MYLVREGEELLWWSSFRGEFGHLSLLATASWLIDEIALLRHWCNLPAFGRRILFAKALPKSPSCLHPGNNRQFVYCTQFKKWTTCMTTWTVCWSSSRRGCWFRCWARGRGGWTIRQSGSTRGKICSKNSTWRHCSASPIVSLLNYCLSGRDVISDLLVSLISKWPRYSRHCSGALARTAAGGYFKKAPGGGISSDLLSKCILSPKGVFPSWKPRIVFQTKNHSHMKTTWKNIPKWCAYTSSFCRQKMEYRLHRVTINRRPLFLAKTLKGAIISLLSHYLRTKRSNSKTSPFPHPYPLVQQ